MGEVRVLQAEVVVVAAAELGEGPGWDAERGRLIWVDILGGRVHEHLPGDPAADRSWPVGEHVGAAVPTPGPELLVALPDGISVLASDGGVTPLRQVEADRPDNRMNDAKCDPQGRLWAGTMPYVSTPGAAALYRMDTDGTVTRALGGISLSNGMGWSADGGTMYHIDSPTQRVDQFDFDPRTGCIRRRRVAVSIDPADGLPDGMTVDDEGYLWVALFGGGQVRRYAPDGRLDTVVRCPASQVTACAFGGRDRDVLYVTCGTYALDEEARAAQPYAGALLAVRPGVTGPPATPFGAVPSMLR